MGPACQVSMPDPLLYEAWVHMVRGEMTRGLFMEILRVFTLVTPDRAGAAWAAVHHCLGWLA